MSIHAMIDLETLGTDPNSVIISLGAIKFDPHTDIEPYGGLYIKADIDEQQDLGRTINDNTLEWWSRQDPKVRDEALTDEGRSTLEDMTNQLNKFLVGVDYIWAQGPAFDIVMLEDLYKDIKKPTPWQFWQIRDSRTLFSLMPVDPRKEIQQDLHNALADAYYQSICVQKTYKALGIKGN